MSLKSAYVIYRVDGVSGLNVFTGINQSQFPSQQLGERSHQSCSQRGSQLSVPQVMLSVPQSWVKRSAQYNKANSLCNSFFQKSLSLTRLSQRECPTMPPDTGVTHPFQKGKTTPRLRGPPAQDPGKRAPFRQFSARARGGCKSDSSREPNQFDGLLHIHVDYPGKPASSPVGSTPPDALQPEKLTLDRSPLFSAFLCPLHPGA